MKTFLNFTRITILAIALVTFYSCNNNDDDGTETIVATNTIADFVANNDDYSSLLAALQKTGLDIVLAGDGDFTVFAPNNAAFDTFLNGTALADVDNNVLVTILLNHVLGSSRTANSFVTGYEKNLATEISSGANLDLYIDTSNGVVLNGQSSVTTQDIITDNGIIHAVSSVINLPTITTFLELDPDFDLALTALTDEGNTAFTDILGDSDLDTTLFVPNNVAITTLLDGTALDGINNATLSRILSNHLISDVVAISTSLSNSYVNTNALFNNDETAPISLYINTDNGVTLNGVSTVVEADIVASNGVIHVVDTVLELPDITTFVAADPNFLSLQTALTADPAFNYIDALQTVNGQAPAPFTTFAPVNSAFEALLVDLGLNELSEIPVTTLASTLELHAVTDTNLRSSELPALNNSPVTTFEGSDIIIQADPAALIDPNGGVNTIITADIQASNGVIHAIDRVLRNL